MRLVSILALALAVTLAPGSPAWGQARVREDFEGPEPRLKFAGADAPYRMEAHQLAGEARHGSFCEYVQVQTGRGNHLHMALPVRPARIINELTVTLWLKADRAGPQVLGRIVLPHTPDPQTGQPATVLVAGQTYRDFGRWQQVRLGGPQNRLPDLLRTATRSVQARLGPQTIIDTREAYLDQIVLNLYVGGGRLRLSVDDLEIAGVVKREAAGTDVPSGRPAPVTPGFALGGPARRKITCKGSQLLIDGRPFFPRAIQYRGESLELLKNLGFNTVQLDRLPSSELLNEAARLKLWLISPPPDVRTATQDGAPPITGQWNRVLAWDLGQGLASAHFETVCDWAKAIRTADRDRHLVARPLMCDVLTDCRAFSRHVNILRPSRRPIGTTLGLADYIVWLRERPRLARPGTPFWTTIQTHTPLAYVDQVSRLAPGATPPSTVSSEQMRLVAFAALAAGVRGLVFESRLRLDVDDPPTRRRRMAIELLNLELSLIEPWAAAGSLSAVVPSSEPEVQAALLQTDKARLVLPMWLSRRGQFVAGQSAANKVSFVVPGVPVSHDAYELTPAGLRRLTDERVTRGVRVTLDQFGPASLILFTDDPLVLRSMKQRVARMAPRAAALHDELAAERFRLVEQLHQQLAAHKLASPQAPQLLSAARAELRQSAAAMGSRRLDEAYRLAHRALRPLRILERGYWDQALLGLSPVSSPATVDVATLPQHWRFVQRVRTSGFGPNRLPAGDCENVDKMRQAGWRLSQHPTLGVRSAADVVSGNSRSGRFCLRLMAQPADPEVPPGLVEAPPVWLTSASVPISAGAVVRIHGWVRVPAPITGSVDGLMIYDSLAGPALAERIDATGGWQEFTLFRVAGPAAQVNVTFVLSGLGEAWIDDVTVEVCRGE